ncbi:MAG: hypothetical protein V4726_08145 [Verrucomicrobiota bacterium]
MKAFRLIPLIVFYTVPLIAVARWPSGRERVSGGQTAAFLERAGAPGTGGGESSSNRRSTPGADGEASLAAALKSGGPAPAMDQVFKATGLDRMLLMARFIQTATAGELEAAIDRSQDEGGYDQTFSDQLWLRWVELDRDAALKHSPQGSVWWAFAKVDPEAALEVAGKAGPGMLGNVIFSIAQGDPSRARELLSQHPEVNAEQVNAGIVEGLEHRDAGAAVAFALEKGSGILESKFKIWMSRDPDQAVAWVQSLANPAQRRRMEDMVLAEHIASDPAAGLEEARRLPAGLRQVSRMVDAIGALAREDPAAARAAAGAMPTAPGNQQALAALTRSLTGSDPAAAVAMVSALDWKVLTTSRQSEWSYESADGQSRSSGYGAGINADDLVAGLMTADPRATADALAALPAESGAPVSTAVQKWAARQPEAASSWLKDLPAGPARDQGIQGLTNWLVNDNPEPDYAAAFAWAGSASPERQEELFSMTLSNWKHHDPAAAAAAVDSLPVSGEQKTRLLNQLKK